MEAELSITFISSHYGKTPQQQADLYKPNGFILTTMFQDSRNPQKFKAIYKCATYSPSKQFLLNQN